MVSLTECEKDFITLHLIVYGLGSRMLPVLTF